MKIRRAAAIVTSPTVPRYEQTARTQPLRTPRAQGVSADAFGAGIGQALQGVSREMQQVYQAEKDKADRTAFLEAQVESAAYENELTFGNDAKQGFLSLKGKSVMDAPDSVLGAWDQRTTEIEAKLPSAEAQQAFRLYRMQKRNDLNGTVQRHVSKEMEAYQKEVNVASLESAVNNAALYYNDPERIAKEIKLGRGVIASDANMGEADAVKFESGVHLAVTRRLLLDDPDQAGGYFEANKDRFTEGDSRTILGPLAEHRDHKAGQTLADSLVAEVVTPTGYVDMEQVRTSIEGSDLNERSRDYAMRRARELATEYQRGVQARREEASQSVYQGVLDKRPYSQQVRDVQANGSLDAHTKITLLDFLDRQYGVSEARMEARADARAAQAEARADAKLERTLGYLSNRYDLQQQYLAGDLPNMSPQQVISTYAGNLGSETDNFAKFVETVNSDIGTAKVTDSELADQVRILRASNDDFAELLPKVDGGNANDRAKMALLQEQVIKIKAAANQGPGKSISTKQAITSALKTVTVNDGWFGWGRPKPIYEVTDKQLQEMTPENKRAYVVEQYRARTGTEPDDATTERLMENLER